MAVAEEQRTDENQSGDEGYTGAALKAAGAAAATGAAAYAVQRALSNRSKNGSDDEGESREKGESQKKGKSRGSGTLLASAASGGWDAARDTIMPLAEDAASAAGKYLAERAPDFVSDRIVPKFIEGFNEARS